IERDQKSPSIIVTMPGSGYKFAAAVRKVTASPSTRPPESADPDMPVGQLRAAVRVEDAPTLVQALPDKPSVAVLPFQNISSDPEQEYFADGIVEDIVTGLSRIKWLFVIARHSSFVYRGKSVGVQQIGRELGVRYLVEGSVRKSEARLRVTAQLIEAESAAHLWADRFDGELKDVFDFQDQITERVVGIVEPNLRRSEIQRCRQKHPESLEAYDLCLRASSHLSSPPLADAAVAAEFLEEALKLDPNSPAAHAYLAWCYQIRFHHSGAFDEADRIAGLQHGRLAISEGVDDATALAA